MLPFAVFAVSGDASDAVSTRATSAPAMDSSFSVLSEKEAAAIQQDLKKKRDTFRTGGEKRHNALSKKRGQEKATRVETLFANMERKIVSRIRRLGELAEKLSRAAAAAEAQGKDVVLIRQKVEEARIQIIAAENALEEVKISYANMAQSSDPTGKAFRAIEAAMRDLKKKASMIKKTLKEISAALK